MRKPVLLILLLFALSAAAGFAADVGIKGMEGFEDFRKMKVIETIASCDIATFSQDDEVNAKVFSDWQEMARDRKSLENDMSYHLELISIDIEGFGYDIICLREKNSLSRERYYILNVFNDDESARTYYSRLTSVYGNYSDLVSRSSVMQLFLNINYADNPAFESYNYYIMGWYYEDSYFTTLCIL